MNNHIIILLDTSYSMIDYSKKIIVGLNKFIQKIKDKDENTIISIMIFSDKRKYLCKGILVKELLKPFTIIDLGTFGMTHLYDAVGEIIEEWINEKRVKHNLFIITDGHDNGSKYVNEEKATQYCNLAVNQGWDITHCGVDISKLGVKEIKYNIDEVDDLFVNLQI